MKHAYIDDDILRAIPLLAAPLLLGGCTGTVDPLGGVIIAELTTEQAQSWCASTYEGMWSMPPTPDGPVQPDGTVVSRYEGFEGGVDYAGSIFPPGLCMLQLPVDQCVANLKLHACQATLQQLEDCMQLAQDTTDPSSVSWEACRAYHAIAGCDRTIIAAALPSDGFTMPWCELPVR